MPTTAELALPPWRRAGGAPASTGLLRQQPGDFRVRELLDLDFSGAGEHDWLCLQKSGVNTAWLARQLAHFAGVPTRDVGFSGLKDRHAVTEQWFSVRRARGQLHDWAELNVPGVTVTRCVRHHRKLRRGTHRANAFELRIRALRGDPEAALQRVAAEGVPNYFGEQRFGRGGGNIAMAGSLFAGKRMKREPRSIALSAARSLIFNDVLDARIEAGTWAQLLAGDIACLDGSNSHFAVPAVDAELAARCAAFDLHPSGPMWGRGGQFPERSAIEQTVLRRHAGFCEGLERHVDAARRSLRVRPEQLRWQLTGDELTISFHLPSGCFATAVLREIVDYTDCSLDSAPA